MRPLVYIIVLLGMIVSNEVNLDHKAPGLYSKTLDGKNFFLSDNLGKSRNIFLSFFTTWCTPCRTEIPVLDSLKNIYSNTDFYLVNVSGLELGGKKMKENPKDVKKFIDMLGVSIPVLMDKYGKAAIKYDALTLPRSVIINSEGNIVYAHTGFVLGDEREFSQILEKLENDEN